MIISTRYKGVERKEKRGSLYGDIFVRDMTPLVFGKYVCFETDVIQELGREGCRLMRLNLRDGRKFEVLYTDFVKGSIVKIFGNPDAREQYMFDINQCLPKKKDDKWDV